jgi:hypothetical protein
MISRCAGASVNDFSASSLRHTESENVMRRRGSYAATTPTASLEARTSSTSARAYREIVST